MLKLPEAFILWQRQKKQQQQKNEKMTTEVRKSFKSIKILSQKTYSHKSIPDLAYIYMQKKVD